MLGFFSICIQIFGDLKFLLPIHTLHNSVLYIVGLRITLICKMYECFGKAFSPFGKISAGAYVNNRSCVKLFAVQWRAVEKASTKRRTTFMFSGFNFQSLSCTDYN